MKNNQETYVKICKDRDKFKLTIPLNLIKKLKTKTNDYLKIIFKDYNCESIIKIPSKSKSRRYLQIKATIPKKLIEIIKLQIRKSIKIEVKLIKNVRSNNLIKNGFLDILSAVPITIENKTILIESLRKDLLKVWYFDKSKPKPITLKRFIKIDRKLGEFFGLMQAESGKKKRK